MSDRTVRALLDRLELAPLNAGVCLGPGKWLETGAAPIVSFNPTTAEPIARVTPATPEAYDRIIEAAQTGFSHWRETAAPQRGLVIRDLGSAVRESIEPLGELISLEMGKIRVEGIGEVQEMIDICELAVGLSRQLYGLTMHSE